MDCGTDYELLIPKIRTKLRKDTETIIAPKYNLNNNTNEFKVHIKNIFVLV